MSDSNVLSTKANFDFTRIASSLVIKNYIEAYEQFNISNYNTYYFELFDESYYEKVLSMRATVKIYYDLLDKIKNKINECDAKYVAKNDGSININTTEIAPFSILNHSKASVCKIYFGEETRDYDCGALRFYHYSSTETRIALGLYMSDNIILMSKDAIYLTKPTNISRNLHVDGKITSNGSNTITHYAPIEDLIDDFEIGKPVINTGKVYKRIDNEWIESTEKDSIDCICSVKTTGTWKEFIGICVRIDEENNSITFASHDDYLVKVDDSSSFENCDEIYINEDNQFKVLDENTPITSKIRRLTIGIIIA